MMEDIMQKLQGILSTKEGQDQLKNIAGMFTQNMGGNPTPPNNSESNIHINNTDNTNNAINTNGILGIENTLGINSNDNPLGGFDLNSLMSLQKVFSTMNTKDKNTELLLALKPHFSDERAQKVDKAITMMRLFSMAPTIMPMLKDSGILKGILPF